MVLITERDLLCRVFVDHTMKARVLASSTRDKTRSRMSSLTLMVILDTAFISYITPKEEVSNAVLLVVAFALIMILLSEEEA